MLRFLGELNTVTHKFIDIVFDGPPSESGSFVEVEDDTGKSISFGKWVKREDGYWVLRINEIQQIDALRENIEKNLKYKRTLNIVITLACIVAVQCFLFLVFT